MRRIEEERDSGPVPLWRHPEWPEQLPWLVQGTTGAGEADAPFDLGLFGRAPAGEVLSRWATLREVAGTPAAVHARQVHGASIRKHEHRCPPGLLVMDGFDGHVSALPGVLLAVSVADCVPVFLADERHQVVALLHAGWRGVAAGILERGMGLLAEDHGTDPGDLRMHCGPAICGECYEVGPEVHSAVSPEKEPPAGASPIDLRAALAARAAALGLPVQRITVSAHCTRCGPGDFFSHRGGSPGRQMGVLGVRS